MDLFYKKKKKTFILFTRILNKIMKRIIYENSDLEFHLIFVTSKFVSTVNSVKKL